MKALIITLTLLSGCKLTCQSSSRDVDSQISENDKVIADINNKVLEIEKRAEEIKVMVGCVNHALDSSMNDHDQILTVEECLRTGRFR